MLFGQRSRRRIWISRDILEIQLAVAIEDDPGVKVGQREPADSHERLTSADLRGGLLGALQALSSGHPHPRVIRHHQVAQLAGKTVFVLPGQGGQYLGMGHQLYERHGTFARCLDECDAALRPWTGWSVREVVCQDLGAPSLERVDVVQPVLFAVMVSLAEVLGGYGISPDAVIGHSQGEIAAAHLAGGEKGKPRVDYDALTEAAGGHRHTPLPLHPLPASCPAPTARGIGRRASDADDSAGRHRAGHAHRNIPRLTRRHVAISYLGRRISLRRLKISVVSRSAGNGRPGQRSAGAPGPPRPASPCN